MLGRLVVSMVLRSQAVAQAAFCAGPANSLPNPTGGASPFLPGTLTPVSLVSADSGPLHLDRRNSDRRALEKPASGFEPVTSARDMRFGSDVVPHYKHTRVGT